MPYVNLQITRGASREQKARIVREFTRTLVEVLGKDPQNTHIVIQEIDRGDWGHAGALVDKAAPAAEG
jgi:4-oxalocrotonate tautomerase